MASDPRPIEKAPPEARRLLGVLLAQRRAELRHTHWPAFPPDRPPLTHSGNPATPPTRGRGTATSSPGCPPATGRGPSRSCTAGRPRIPAAPATPAPARNAAATPCALYGCDVKA